MPYHQQQLEFMIRLADQRLEFLNPFFRFLHYFDTPYFFFVLIPIIWLAYSYQWGLRIFYWFTFNSLVVSFAKKAIGWPRPSQDFPELAFFHPPSHGFPSGGAETSMLLGCLFIYYWRTPFAWITGLSYIFLISFSRLYLGVHYPIDVLGGWCIAWVIFFLLISTKDPIENWLKRKGLPFSLFLTLAIPLFLIALFPKPSMYEKMGAAMGIGIGTYISLRKNLFLSKPKNWNEGVNRSAIGIAILFLLFFLLPIKHPLAKSFILGLFMSLAASPICKWFTESRKDE